MNLEHVNDILKFLHRTKALESQRRYGSSMVVNRNSVAEHSWRLGLMTIVLITEFKVKLDMAKVLSLCTIHDLPEAKTGDIDAYKQIIQGQKLIDDKKILETRAMYEITDGLYLKDKICELWEEYENQKTLESKFVKAIDRIEGFLHISEVGVEGYIPKEFHSTYADKAVISFDQVLGDFPELKVFLETIKASLKSQFEKVNVAWVD